MFHHTLCVVNATPPIIEIRLAALLHDIGKPKTFTLDDDEVGHFYGHQDISGDMSEIILKRLRTSNEMIDTVKILVKEHMTQHNDYSKKGLKRLINRVGREKIYWLLDLQKADMICTSYGRDTSSIEDRRAEIKEIIEGGNESNFLVQIRKYRKGGYASETLKDVLYMIDRRN